MASPAQSDIAEAMPGGDASTSIAWPSLYRLTIYRETK